MNDFDSQLNAFFDSLDRKIDYIPQIIAETSVEYFKDSFRTKSWDGEPWKPYKNKKREPKRGSLMQRSPGGLASTVRPSIVSAPLVRISAGNSRINYARVHNEGLRVRAVQYVRPHHNNNFMGKGKRVQIQGHSKRIDFLMPRRQFMGKSGGLLNAIKTRINNHLKS